MEEQPSAELYWTAHLANASYCSAHLREVFLRSWGLGRVRSWAQLGTRGCHFPSSPSHLAKGGEGQMDSLCTEAQAEVLSRGSGLGHSVVQVNFRSVLRARSAIVVFHVPKSNPQVMRSVSQFVWTMNRCEHFLIERSGEQVISVHSPGQRFLFLTLIGDCPVD